MNLRLKFLTFLGVFLLGSFLIITWKSYNIFSQKYATAMGQAEMQKLEVQAQTIVQRFHNFQIALQESKSLESQLKGLGVQLFAHVINEQGKWKAQWFEGKPGARAMAQSATQQIGFASLSTSRKSWHLVNAKELGSGLAYVIPSVTKTGVSFYVFFLNKEFFSKAFQGQTQQDHISLISPYLGEIYSSGFNPANAETLEKYKKKMMDQQSGVLASDDSRSMIFLFNPDLQLYLVKTKKLADLTVDKPLYMLTLGLMILVLIGTALFAQDLLLKKVQQGELSLDDGPVATPAAQADGQEATTETAVAESPADSPAEALLSPPKDNALDLLLKQIRPKAINSLGYLHKIKQSSTSPHVTLLEAELRELRSLIDPKELHSEMPALRTQQPTFNPFLKETFTKDAHASVVAQATPEESNEKSVLIRKPKREANESR